MRVTLFSQSEAAADAHIDVFGIERIQHITNLIFVTEKAFKETQVLCQILKIPVVASFPKCGFYVLEISRSFTS